jgi:LPS export ABC transporter protein LptC
VPVAVLKTEGSGYGQAVRVVLPLLVVVSVWSACSFDYTAARVEADGNRSRPEVELLQVRMVVQRETRLELSAARIATYEERREQEFELLVFREFGSDGQLRLEGEAEAGVMNLDTEDVELLGTVRFFSRVEEAVLESSSLSWRNADRLLLGDPEETVTIRRDDGSWVHGQGIRVDGRRNQVAFENGLEGEFVGDTSP